VEDDEEEDDPTSTEQEEQKREQGPVIAQGGADDMPSPGLEMGEEFLEDSQGQAQSRTRRNAKRSYLHLLASLPSDEEAEESDSDYVDEDEDQQNNKDEDDIDFDDEDAVGVDATEEALQEARILWKNSFNSLQLNLPCRHKKSAQRKEISVKIGMKHKKAGQRSSDPPTITPAYRVAEFPNQSFELSPASDKDFYCRCCLKTMSTKLSTP